MVTGPPVKAVIDFFNSLRVGLPDRFDLLKQLATDNLFHVSPFASALRVTRRSRVDPPITESYLQPLLWRNPKTSTAKLPGKK